MAPAHGGTITTVHPNFSNSIVYSGAPGERNTVAISNPLLSTIIVSDVGNSIQPLLPGALRLPFCLGSPVGVATCVGNSTTSVYIRAGDADDSVDLTALPASRFGQVELGPGDDSFTGGSARSDVTGGLGADRISGAFQVRYAADGVHDAGVHVTLGGGADDGLPGEGDDLTEVRRLFLTPGPDVVLGTDRDEYIQGGGGTDVLRGAGGNDSLGAEGSFLDGGDGDDRVANSGTSGTLVGGPGHDVLETYSLGDGMVIDAGAGDDIVLVHDSINSDITCGPGLDRVTIEQPPPISQLTPQTIAADCEIVTRTT